MSYAIVDDTPAKAPAIETDDARAITTTETRDVRIYRYGCFWPSDPVSKERVVKQMLLAHRYRNDLVAVERARRGAAREVTKEDPERAWKLRMIERRAALVRKALRARCGVYWGTYQLIEQAVQDSAKKLPFYKDPHFERWTGDGAVSVQIIGGLELDKFLANESTQVQLTGTPITEGSNTKRGTGQSLRLRIGSEGRAPIWADFPVRFHRPFPVGTVIKRVTVRRRLGGALGSDPTRGRREYWTAEFSLEIPTPEKRCGSGVVAVDLGWRRIDDELRVCAFASEDGRDIGELRLSGRQITVFDKTASLRQLRDLMLSNILGIITHSRDSMPEWFRDETASAHLWRSQGKVHRLYYLWANRQKAGVIDGDNDLFAWLKYWVRRDRHLWDWENGSRRRSLHRRRKVYEDFAARLAEKYDVLVLEDFDLRTFAKRPDKDAPIIDDLGRRETQQAEKARAWRHLAATSELRHVLVNAFLTRGGGVVEYKNGAKWKIGVPAQNTTRTCNNCGLVSDRDFAASVDWTCECGTSLDQDINASNNLCERFRALEKTGTARIRKAGKTKEERASRYVRARTKKQEAEELAKRPKKPRDL
jgi:hypothetical protein